MRIYVAGPMTGIEAYNAPAFAEAAKRLRAAGHDVITPFDTNSRVWREHKNREFDPAVDKCDYGGPMLNHMVAADMIEVAERDAIALLPGWEKSRGTMAELHVATLLNKRVLDATTGLDIAVQVTVKGQRWTPPLADGPQMELFSAA